MKSILRKNAYLENFIDKFCKKFLEDFDLVKENAPAVEKKCSFLALPYLGVITLQIRNKLQQTFKGILNCCKLEIT